MIDLSAVNSTHGIGYLTLIISFQLLQYKDRDIKDCHTSALASFNFTKSWDKVMKILLCSTFYVLQVSGKQFHSCWHSMETKKNRFFKNLSIFMLGRLSHHLIHARLKHYSEIFSKII